MTIRDQIAAWPQAPHAGAILGWDGAAIHWRACHEATQARLATATEALMALVKDGVPDEMWEAYDDARAVLDALDK